MRTFYFTLCLLSCAITALSQDLKKIKNTNDRVRTSQVFYVLKDKLNIKQGDFIYKYKGKLRFKGSSIKISRWVSGNIFPIKIL